MEVTVYIHCLKPVQKTDSQVGNEIVHLIYFKLVLLKLSKNQIKDWQNTMVFLISMSKIRKIEILKKRLVKGWALKLHKNQLTLLNLFETSIKWRDKSCMKDS